MTPWTRRHYLLTSLLCVFAFGNPATSLAQPELDWKGLAKGQFEIGFSVKHVYDSSRSFGDMKERPIQIAVW